MVAPAAQPSPGLEPERAPWTRADRLALGLLLLWVGICFAPTLGFGFVHWDDHEFLLTNPLLLDPGSVPLLHHLTTPELGYPVPVTVASYRIEHAIAGFDHPWLFHLVNLLLHLMNVALLFTLARTLGLGTLAATLAACLLGLHPVVSEPVSWVTGRKDLLALGFALLTLRLALAQPSRPRHAARLATFLLALFSKPVAAALAPILVLVAAVRRPAGEAWPRRLRAALTGHAAEVGIVLAYLPLAWLGYRSFGASRTDEDVVVSLRSAWYGLGTHLGLVVGAEPPCVQHLTELLPPPFTPRLDLLPIAVAGAVALLLWRLRGRARGLAAVALACSFLAYLPSSGLVPIKRFLADSYVYPVLPGVGLALATFAESRLAGWPGAARWGALAVLAMVLGLLTVPASGRFRTTKDLWAHAMERYPESPRMCRNWAVAMREMGGPARTLAATDRCIVRFGPETFEKNRAVALFELGRGEEAAAWMRRALARRPDDRNAPAALLELAERAR